MRTNKNLPTQVLGPFVESLFDWSRVKGFTTANTVHDFVVVLHSNFTHISLL